MIRTISNRYSSQTPLRWKIMGDSILILGAAISGAVMGLPMPDNTKLWINFAVVMVMAVGKILTNLATEISKSESSEPPKE